MISCAECKICGKCEVVHPVGVGRQGIDELARGGRPDFDCLIVRGSVNVPSATPTNTRYGALMAGEDQFDTF